MNTLTKIILAPLTLAVTTLSTQSVQAFTYTISDSAPCDPFGCTGNVDVMGTIETDGTLGAITLANIVNWELVLNMYKAKKSRNKDAGAFICWFR